MMNLLDDDKKKDATLIIGIGEEKSSSPALDKIFSALKSGDKSSFAKAFKVYVKECLYDHQYSDEEE